VTDRSSGRRVDPNSGEPRQAATIDLRKAVSLPAGYGLKW
jgi:hypothetical protein